MECETVEKKPAKNIQYLAYGSNMSAETFLGKRKIHPISQMNVCVPSLKLTFDLPAIPYAEPCFANSAARNPDSSEILATTASIEVLDEKASSARLETIERDIEPQKSRYHKDAWHKPMVGVLYELTPKDYARVVASEGGGASYTDIVIPCYPLEDSATTVPMHPTTKPVEGHTLFAPAGPPERLDLADSGGNTGERRSHRPDPAYAQPSARYLKLLMDGAREHNLPREYQDYLAQIRPYRITTIRQRVGKGLFLAMWLPILAVLFALARLVTDEKGQAPKWMAKLFMLLFRGIWTSYDGFYRKIFGNGERTIGE